MGFDPDFRGLEGDKEVVQEVQRPEGGTIMALGPARAPAFLAAGLTRRRTGKRRTWPATTILHRAKASQAKKTSERRLRLQGGCSTDSEHGGSFSVCTRFRYCPLENLPVHRFP